MRSWLKPCTVIHMSETDAAWLAGFFDGEGTLCQCLSGNGRKSWKISLPNTCLEAVQKCRELTGAGTVVKRKARTPGHWKDQWRWSVNSQRNIAAICRQMTPYLVVKRDAVSAFLTQFNDLP